MGVFFWVRSVALIEDLPLAEEYSEVQKLNADINNGYQQVGGGGMKICSY